MGEGKDRRVYRFAGRELIPAERRLRVAGQPVSLTPKVFDTLVLLVQHAGHVVSKDELMAALWPRGFVHESNLTKHIWLLRRALGDGEGESRFIETVPKLGYRFIAPVEVVDDDAGGASSVESAAPAVVDPSASPAEAAATVPPASASLWYRQRMTWIAAVLFAAGGLGVAVWQMKQRATPAVAADPTAVAIVDFGNLSGNSKDAWLDSALQQMLTTEIAADGKLHALPGDQVRTARADLSPPDAGGYAPDMLRRLQQRLGTRYVVSGVYLVTGNDDAAQVRVDVAVQDAGNRKSIGSFSRAAPMAQLPQLVSAIGVDLRSRFGMSADPLLQQQIANAQPATAEIARHMGFGLDALQRYDPARARDELLLAAAQAPGYAPVYAALANAYAMMGYRSKATAAVNMAVSYAGALPPEERLRIEVQRAQLTNDTQKGIAAAQEWVALRPALVDARLRLADLLANAGRQEDAEKAMAELQRLPAANSDPRVELQAAVTVAKKGDNTAALPHAREALRLAEARGDPGLIAAAHLAVGKRSPRGPDAEKALRSAAAEFHGIGNPRGEARAYQNLGNLLGDLGQNTQAREAYQRALSMYQAIGDLAGQAGIYDNQAITLWDAGDSDGAATAVRESLRLARETNDKVREAWCLAALAQIAADTNVSDDAMAMLRQAIALDRGTGEREHLAFSLAIHADLLHIRGELDAAREACTQAMALVQVMPDTNAAYTADMNCARVALEFGEADKAEALLTAFQRAAHQARDTLNEANAELSLGSVALGRRQWPEARRWLSAAIEGFKANDQAAGQANAGAALALAERRMGNAAASNAALEAARKARAKSSQGMKVLAHDIIAAQLTGETGDALAMNKLQAIADDAARRHWLDKAFDARLARVEALQESGAASAATERTALLADARRSGFRWIERQLSAR